MVAFYWCPGYTQYCATKVFVKELFEALWTEMNGSVEYNWFGFMCKGNEGKIDFCNYQSGYVATKMSILQKESYAVPTPMVAAEGALKDLGLRPTSHSVLPHHFVGWVFRFMRYYMPRNMVNEAFYKLGLKENSELKSMNYKFF